jgi:hypothetical protein
MTWNHRVFEVKHPHETYFEFREVYYDEQGNVIGYTQEGTSPMGEDMDALRRDMGRMLLALDKPVLKDEDFPQFKDVYEEDDNNV